MFRYLLVTVLAAGCLLTAAQTGQESGCTGPTYSVRITAQQLTRTPPTFAFLVTNLTDSPIRKIVIGRAPENSVDTEVVAAAFNLPTSMASPARWTGIHAIGDDSALVVYIWRTTDLGKGIMPRESASGFAITLPALPTGQRKQYAGAREVVQTNFTGLPFRVDTADGRCYWGFVGADLLEH